MTRLQSPHIGCISTTTLLSSNLSIRRPIFVDVSVACPAAPTHRRRVVSSASTTQFILEREKRKLDHYESLILNHDHEAQFLPFAVTVLTQINFINDTIQFPQPCTMNVNNI